MKEATKGKPVINGLPVIGWLISFIVNVSLAVPFWICWTTCGLGAWYFDFLPPKYQSIPFWHCVGLFMIASILKVVLVPRIASVSSSSESDKKK